MSLRELTVNQVASRLSRRFPKSTPRQVWETVAEEYDLLADNPVRLYVPNLIEHDARERLREAARGRADQVITQPGIRPA